jgi:uncharacterized protein YtpQ (UPF0354 family)
MGFLSWLFGKQKVDSIKENLDTKQTGSGMPITLESLLNDPTFEKEQPELFRAFKEELKLNEPELYKQRFGNQPTESNILDIIVPIIKVGQQPITTIKDHEGVTHELPTSSQIVIHPIFDELGVVFGVDKGSHYEWLQNKHIPKNSGMTTDDIISKAYSNLVAQISEKMSIQLGDNGLGMLTNCNRLESSLILMDSVWSSIEQSLNTKCILFSIPTQDIFAFCDVNNDTSVTLLKNTTNEIFNNPAYQKKISPKIYFRDESKAIKILADE